MIVYRNKTHVVAVSASSLVANGGETIRLTGTVTDYDTSQFTYSWSAGPNLGTFARPTALATDWTAPPPTGFEQLVRLQLRADDVGEEPMTFAKGFVSVKVRANQPPEFGTGPVSPIVVRGGETMTLNAFAPTDPEGYDLTHAWTSPGGGSFTDAAVRNARWRAPAAADFAQAFDLTLTAGDPHGGEAAATLRVVVQEDRNEGPDQVSLPGARSSTMTLTVG